MLAGRISRADEESRFVALPKEGKTFLSFLRVKPDSVATFREFHNANYHGFMMLAALRYMSLRATAFHMRLLVVLIL